MNKFLKYAVAPVASLALMAQSAHAALPTAVTDALDAMQTDAVTLSTAFLVVCIAIGAIKVLKRGAS